VKANNMPCNSGSCHVLIAPIHIKAFARYPIRADGSFCFHQVVKGNLNDNFVIVVFTWLWIGIKMSLKKQVCGKSPNPSY